MFIFFNVLQVNVLTLVIILVVQKPLHRVGSWKHISDYILERSLLFAQNRGMC